MATYGTINGSFNGVNAQYLTFRCDWEVISQDKANKTSTVGLKWIVTKTNSTIGTFKSNTPWSQTCDGVTTSGSLNFNLGNVATNTDYVVRNTTVVIQHASNGTKTFSISGTLDLSGTKAGVGTFSGNNIALPTIATTPPIISAFTIQDLWTHPASVAAYVDGFSRFKLTATASATSPATIASYAFYNGDTLLYSVTTTSGSANFSYSEAVSAGTYKFKVIVTDSYGNASTSTYPDITVVSYSPPILQRAMAYRSDANGNPDSTSTSIRLRIKYTLANITGNSATAQTVVGGNTYVWSLQSASRIESGFPTTNSYDAVFTVTDVFGTTVTATAFVPSQFINLDLYPDATNGGAAFGMMAKQGTFSVNHDAEFFGSLMQIGGINFANIHEYYDTDTTTSTSDAVVKTYTVSGDGLVWASTSVKCDNTSAAGYVYSQVDKNLNLYGYSLNRYGSSTSSLGSTAAAFIKVTTGDTIKLTGKGTKSGTKTLYYNLLAIGCTLSTS